MKEEISIYEEYFEYTRKYTEIYGPRTVVCMQVGSFYEIYGLKYPNSEEITGSLISEISEITGLAVSSKKYTYRDATVYMSGFRDLYHTFEKYLNILMDHGYIVVEIVQKDDVSTGNNSKKKTRGFKAVHSAGTHLSYETDRNNTLSNHIMAIWMESCLKTKRIIYGVSVLNIYTGESAIFEHDTEDWMNPATFDELERYVAMYSPNEVIFLHSLGTQEKIQKIRNYIKLGENILVHLISLDDTSCKTKKTVETVERCKKQIYIQYVLSKYFGVEGDKGTDVFESCLEFAFYMYATQSLCYLLHFIEEHNYHFVKKLQLPIFQNTSKRVVLANHTLKQLNILSDANEDGKKQGHLGSVLSFLNKCMTPMGKRMFQNQLLQPVFDEDWLETEYSITDYFLYGIKEETRDHLRKKLAKIRDIEKIGRQILCKKIYLSSIHELFKSVLEAREIYEFLEPNVSNHVRPFPEEMIAYLFSQPSSVRENQTKIEEEREGFFSGILDFFGTRIILNKCQENNSFLENIVKPKVSRELDDFVSEYQTQENILTQIHHYFLQFLPKKNGDEDTDYIKIVETEKAGISFQITKNRGNVLIKNLTIEGQKEGNKGILTISPEISISVKEIKIQSATKTNYEIDFPLLTKTTRDITNIKQKIQEINKILFLQIIEEFERTQYDNLEKVLRFISKVDVIVCKAWIADKYRYCRPRICREATQAFIDAKDIRHVLIEHLNQNEIYVPNDIVLGPSSDSSRTEVGDGIVLFGTNAVGKTSLIRSIGITIIMAQAGLFVPCSSMEYKPYTAIFSRILSNDNLFKGLSTFAVEISELGVILKNADENSLILGDELCSGTETDSALAIFMAALEHLHEKRSSFLFATHFHEILEMDILASLSRIRICHLAVIYDREKDMLIYDRKIRSGEGSRTYGLEVCKSLYLPAAFIERAYTIRRTLCPENDGILSHSSSRYNTRKIKGMCEKCGKKMGEEIHHLREQKEADVRGYFEEQHWIHKNHPANLMSICSVCHDEIHSHSMIRDKVVTETDSGNISPITLFTSFALNENREEPELEIKPKKKIVRKKTTKGYQII